MSPRQAPDDRVPGEAVFRDMVSRDVTVACCQVPLSVAEPAGNRRVLSAAISRAAADGAEIVVLPELAASGYMFESMAELEAVAEDRNGSTLRQWCDLAAEHGVVIVGGFVEAGQGGHFHNSAAIVDESGVRAIYRKVHLWDHEREWFTPGEAAPPVVATRFGRIGVVICYDLEFPEWVRIVALSGAEILCAPTNWPLYPIPQGEKPAEIVKVQADAGVNRIYLAVCDRTRAERGAEWIGGSAIVDPNGFFRTELRLGEEAIISARIDMAEASSKAVGNHNDVFLDRRPDLYERFHLQP